MEKRRLVHSAAEVLIEQFGAVDLSINALVHFEDNILAFHSLRAVVLRKFHEKRFVCCCGLWQKAKVKSTCLDFQPLAAARTRPALTVGHPTKGL